MRTGISCSWCHETNWVDSGCWPMCKNCGHRADAPRMECDCISCIRADGKPAEQLRSREVRD